MSAFIFGVTLLLPALGFGQGEPDVAWHIGLTHVVSAFDVSPTLFAPNDAHVLMIGGSDGSLKFVDTQSGKVLRWICPDGTGIQGARFCGNDPQFGTYGETLVVGTAKGFYKYDLSSPLYWIYVGFLPTPAQQVNTVDEVLESGTYFRSSSRIYDLQTLSLVCDIPGGAGALNPTGTQAANGDHVFSLPGATVAYDFLTTYTTYQPVWWNASRLIFKYGEQRRLSYLAMPPVLQQYVYGGDYVDLSAPIVLPSLGDIHWFTDQERSWETLGHFYYGEAWNAGGGGTATPPYDAWVRKFNLTNDTLVAQVDTRDPLNIHEASDISYHIALDPINGNDVFFTGGKLVQGSDGTRSSIATTLIHDQINTGQTDGSYVGPSSTVLSTAWRPNAVWNGVGSKPFPVLAAATGDSRVFLFEDHGTDWGGSNAVKVIPNGDAPTSLTWSNDGRYLMVSCGLRFSSALEWTPDGKVKVYDADANYALAVSIDPPTGITAANCVLGDPAKGWMGIGYQAQSNALRIRDLANSTFSTPPGALNGPVEAMALSANGKFMAVAQGDSLSLWEVPSSNPNTASNWLLRTQIMSVGSTAATGFITPHITRLAFDPGSNWLAVSEGEAAGGGGIVPTSDVIRFNLSDSNQDGAIDALVPTSQYTGSGNWICSQSISPDGRLLIAGCGDGKIRLWDTGVAGSPVQIFDQRAGGSYKQGTAYPGVNSITFEPDGQRFAYGMLDSSVVVANVPAAYQAPILTALSPDTASIGSNDTFHCTVTLNKAAPAGGIDIAVRGDQPEVQTPAIVHVDAGSNTSSPFLVTVANMTAGTVAHVYAKYLDTELSAGPTVSSLPPPPPPPGSYSLAAVATFDDIYSPVVEIDHKHDQVYVGGTNAGSATSSIHVLSASSFEETQAWSVPGGLSDMSLDWRRDRLGVVSCSIDLNGNFDIFAQALSVQDGSDAGGFGSASLPSEGTYPARMAVDSQSGVFFVTGSSSLHSFVPGGASNSVYEPYVNYPSVDPLTGKVFVRTDAGISAHDASTLSEVGVASGGGSVEATATDPNNHVMFGAPPVGGGGIAVYDSDTLAHITTMDPGWHTFESKLDRRRGLLYALQTESGTLNQRIAIYKGQRGHDASGWTDSWTYQLYGELSPPAGCQFTDIAADSVTGDFFVVGNTGSPTQSTLFKLVEPNPAPGKRYEAKTIGRPEWLAAGQDYEVAGWALNEHGQVAGYAVPSSGLTDALSYVNDLDGVLYAFGEPGYVALGINNLGQMSGRKFLSLGPSLSEAIVSDLAGNITNLGFLGGEHASVPGINDNGLLAGFRRSPGGVFEGLIGNSDGTGMSFYGSPYGRFLNINELGHAAGVIGNPWHAWFFPSGPGMDLGLLPTSPVDGSSVAYGLNDFDQVVGYSSATDYNIHPFVWDSTNGMIDLGVVAPSDNGFSYATNNDGQVVGAEDQGAILFDPLYGLQFLDPLVNILPEHLVESGGVNNVGQLTANSDFNAYILDPIREGLAALSVSPGEVSGGGSATGRIVLRRAGASPGGTEVFLTSDDPAASVPASVIVPEGQFVAEFPITTFSVAAETDVVISAELNGEAFATVLTVTDLHVQSLTFSPNPVVGGASSTGTVTLSRNAPAGGITVNLTSPDPVVTVPASVFIAEGTDAADFATNTTPVLADATVLVQAEYGLVSTSGGLSVHAPRPVSLVLSPTSVGGGNSSHATVTLDGPAPAGYEVVVASDDGAATVSSPQPGTEGGVTLGFDVTTTPVNVVHVAHISASYLGSAPASGALTIRPPGLSAHAFSPPSIFAGGSSTGTVTLEAPAPAGGAVVTLTSSSNRLTVPATVTIPAGLSSASYTATQSGPNPPTSITVTADYQGSQKAAMLQVMKVELLGLLFQNGSGQTLSSARTGDTIYLLVRMTGPVASAVTVNLSSSNKKVLPVANTKIPAGSTSARVAIKVGKVTSPGVYTVTGTYNGISKNASITVNP